MVQEGVWRKVKSLLPTSCTSDKEPIPEDVLLCAIFDIE